MHPPVRMALSVWTRDKLPSRYNDLDLIGSILHPPPAVWCFSFAYFNICNRHNVLGCDLVRTCLPWGLCE
ncbi:hypothetical protein ACTXT7_003030 [Hymenolepis weldensis]